MPLAPAVTVIHAALLIAVQAQPLVVVTVAVVELAVSATVRDVGDTLKPHAVTVTAVWQVAVVLEASIAMQLTGVLPTGNSEPDAGEHIVVDGGIPPATDGAKFTATGFPLEDVADGTGHVIVSGNGGVVYVSTDELGLRTRAAL